MNKLGMIVAFSLGAAAGSVVTWKLLKNKYEQEVQEAVETYRDVYSNRPIPEQRTEELYSEEAPVEEPKPEPEKEDTGHLDQILKRYVKTAEVKKEDEEYGIKPYVITPEEFDQLDDYDIVTYAYYADGVLANDEYEVVTDIDRKIGRDSLKTFGQYEEDSVYVRNDRLKIDYEILLDVRKYSDVIKER